MKFINWYFQDYLIAVLKYYFVFLAFLDKYFGVKLLIIHLFSPWKRTDSAHLGFVKKSFLETLTLNLLSRFIGFFVRIVTLLFSLSIIGITFVIGIPVLIFLAFGVLPGLIVYLALDKEIIYSPYDSIQIIINKLVNSEWWKFFIQYTQLPEPELTKILKESKTLNFIKAQKEGKTLTSSEVFRLLIENNTELESWLFAHNVSIEDLEILNLWFENNSEEKLKYSWLNPDYLLSTPSITGTWHYGYTPFLDKLTTDLSKSDWRAIRFVSRNRELEQLTDSLCRSEQPFTIIHGSPGVGRRSLILGLAQSISWESMCLSPYTRILILNSTQFLQSDSQHPLSTTFNQILKEAQAAGNIVLVLPNLHELLEQKHDPDFNIAEILDESFNLRPIPIVGLTTTQDFKRLVLPNSTLNKWFSDIELPELSKIEILEIAHLNALDYESKYNLLFTFQALKIAYEIASVYLTQQSFPEKILDLLEKASQYASKLELKIFNTKEMREFLSNELKLDLTEIDEKSSQQMATLEADLSQEVLDQDLAVQSLAAALRRARTQINDTKKPLATFLFLGPTGVGKTATAKAITKLYFKNQKMIRFDMAEYQTSESLNRLIGTPHNLGELAEKITRNPRTVLLLDEFEKAPKLIHNLFLTILDEGYFITGNDTRVNCRNLIIIATSNAASNILFDLQNQISNQDKLKETMIATLINQGFYSAELLNRFDEIVLFKSLSPKTLRKVIIKELEELSRRLEKHNHLIVTFADSTVTEILEKGYDPIFGVRSIQHYIKRYIEDKISQQILTDPNIKNLRI